MADTNLLPMAATPVGDTPRATTAPPGSPSLSFNSHAEDSSHGSWQTVLDAAVPAIVALQVTAVRSFQDDHAGAHGGTGFVVDAERGLLLTNRHVCTCGPARAAATFVGGSANEEVPVDVAYLDPVHDFALLRFDPRQLQQTPRSEIELDPAGCRVGEEIRVVGNDSLEKLQILSGTIARIDRNSPDLAGDFHDENTFYAIAGSGTRGGSSGSPVLNRSGKAVALNAAAVTGTMHGFYLPLQRVARALDAIRASLSVPRGTICTSLSYTSFPECLRLGVTKEYLKENIMEREPPAGGTFSKATPPGGMLQVRRCISGSAADKVLRPGDILLKLEGQPCADFVILDDVLDRSVGQSVKLTLCRGGQHIELELDVQDLHSLIPHAFIELGLGVFHEVPYQTAQKHHIPLQGIYVAQAGFVFGEAVKSDAVMLEINGNPCHNLQRFEELLQQIPEKEYFTVSWMLPKNAKERTKIESFVKMQRHWCTFRAWSLDWKTRMWSPRRIGSVAAVAADDVTMLVEAEVEEEASQPPQSQDGAPPAKKPRKGGLTGARGALDKTICAVNFRTVQNFNIDLVANLGDLENDVYSNIGAGIIVDAEAGLILTDRTTVPQPLGDIEVTLGEDSRSASVWFMHPNHSFVILKLDTSAGTDKPNKFGKDATFVDHSLEGGDELDFVGVDSEGNRFGSKVTVQGVHLVEFPRHWPPRWHERNLEAVALTDDPSNAKSGVICNEQGHIYAVYALAPCQEEAEISHSGYALPTYTALPILQHIKSPKGKSVPPVVPSLEIDLRNEALTKLRRLPAKLRPPVEWLKKLSIASKDAGNSGGTALKVGSVASNGPCYGRVAEGDLLVAVAGHVVTTVKSVEEKLMEAVAHVPCDESVSSSNVGADVSENTRSGEQAGRTSAEVKLTLLRRDKIREVTVPVRLLGNDGARRVVCWNGLVLQETPRCVQEFGKVPSGVYVCEMLLGSPGETDGLEGDFLLTVDGVPTPSLDAILALGSRQPSLDADAAGSGRFARGRAGEARRHMRVETSDVSGRRFMKALEPDPLFWPTIEISMNQHGAWTCVEHCG